MRKSPPSASCSSWLICLTDNCARSSVALRVGAPASNFAEPGLRAMSAAPAPYVDRCRLGLPDARIADAGQRRQSTVLGAECDPVIGLRHHGGFAGERIAQHGEAVAGADHEGEEAVEIGERGFERPCQAVTLARAPSQI